MKTKNLPALLAIGALALAGCGEGSENASSGAAKAGGNPTDRAFVAEMIPHHDSALEMAKIAQKRGESTFVKKLADDILRTQSEEISTLRREDGQLAEAGVKTGSLGVPAHMMGMSEDTQKLTTAKPFDEPFIEMMVPHHKGAIEMAEVELAKGADPELKALARQIIAAQQREIDQMTAHLGGAAGDGGHHGAVAPEDAPGGATAARRGPVRGTALEAAAAGEGPRDIAVPASE